MNDPHVEKLFYKIRLGENVDYDKAKPIGDETEDFKMSIKGDMVEITMKTHFPTEKEAIDLVDRYIRGWEIEIGLAYGPDDLRFEFQHSEIIDRSPPTVPGDTLGIARGFSDVIGISDHVDIKLHMGNYILPKKNFAVSPDVESMYSRYKGYRHGKETLLAMAYFCLTVLDSSAGGRSKAAKQYSIVFDVLRKLGEICSTRGDGMQARKALAKGEQSKPLTSKENTWTEAVIKAMIRRAGEWEFDSANLKQLTMEDFPPLDQERSS